jgi:hypothetical protein
MAVIAGFSFPEISGVIAFLRGFLKCALIAF